MTDTQNHFSPFLLFRFLYLLPFLFPGARGEMFPHLRTHTQEAIVTHFIQSYMRTVFGTVTAVQKLKPQPPSPQN